MNHHGVALATECPSSERAADDPIRPPSWMLLRIALETRDHHPPADADRLAVMDATTAAEYRKFLSRVYGWQAAFETALAASELERQVVISCAKADRARQDLRTLAMTDLDIDALPRCAVPPLRSAAAALGWLFVDERLTLLSGLIRRHLARALPAEMAEASTYLSACGDAPGERFRELGDVLADHARRSAAMPAQMVAAARDAFRVQRQWFSPRRQPTTDSRARAR